MNTVRRSPRQYSAATARAVADAIEWEELPSLARRLQPGSRRPADVPLARAAWDDTAPSTFDTVPASLDFVDLDGLAIREVIEPDVFDHLFGPNAD